MFSMCKRSPNKAWREHSCNHQNTNTQLLLPSSSRYLFDISDQTNHLMNFLTTENSSKKPLQCANILLSLHYSGQCTTIWSLRTKCGAEVSVVKRPTDRNVYFMPSWSVLLQRGDNMFINCIAKCETKLWVESQNPEILVNPHSVIETACVQYIKLGKWEQR